MAKLLRGLVRLEMLRSERSKSRASTMGKYMKRFTKAGNVRQEKNLGFHCGEHTSLSNDREVVVLFTKGVLDRIRDFAKLNTLPEVGVWRVEKNGWVFDGGLYLARIFGVRYFHSKDRDYFRVFLEKLGSKSSEEIGTYETFEMAQDSAEGAVYAAIRGFNLFLHDKEKQQSININHADGSSEPVIF
jgi:hypothetical protein